MYDMAIRLRADGGKCLYEQIYEHIRQEIREGKLLTGERLPSTRSLAEYLQVARSTVDIAYDQLVSEGYIESKPYKGFFVCPIEGVVSLPSGRTEAMADEAARRAPKEPGLSYQYDFSPNAIEMAYFPFSVWRGITRDILTDTSGGLFAQGEPQGDEELRVTISRYLHSSRGVNCRPEQIIVGAGNDYLLILLVRLLGNGTVIAMENPTYKRAFRIFRSFGCAVRAVEMDENGMRVDALERTQAKAAYVMPSHQFPTGCVMPIGRRMELLRWACGGEDRYLIEDDYDSEFRYRGKPIPALQSSDDQGRVIYLGTFSKAIAPAIRVSFLVLPDALLERYRRDCAFLSCTVSRIDQRILDEFVRNGYFERHLNKMRKVYKGRHELLLGLLEPFSKSFAISGENAGLHLVLTSRDGVSESELRERAGRAGVKVYGMSESGIAGEGNSEADADSAGTEGFEPDAREIRPGTILIGFGGLSEEELKKGIARLREAWRIV